MRRLTNIYSVERKVVEFMTFIERCKKLDPGALNPLDVLSMRGHERLYELSLELSKALVEMRAGKGAR